MGVAKIQTVKSNLIKDAEKETWPKQCQHPFVFYTDNVDTEPTFIELIILNETSILE